MNDRQATPIIIPPRFPSDGVVVLTNWAVSDGAHVAADTAVATVEASKSTCDVYAPVDGYVRRRNVMIGDEIAVGGVLGFVTHGPHAPLPEDSLVGALKSVDALKSDAQAESLSRGLDAVRTTLEPAPRRLAAALSAHNRNAVVSRNVVRVALQPVQDAVRQLQPTVGMLTVGELVAWHAARLLRSFPELNATLQGHDLFLHQKVHLGFVVDLGNRLLVPVIRDGSELSLREFCTTLKDLVLSSARGEITAPECKDGTFTVSNLFSQGVIDFDPILNVDQSAILGISAPDEASFRLGLAFDHRIVTGKRAAEFLQALNRQLTSSNVAENVGEEPAESARNQE